MKKFSISMIVVLSCVFTSFSFTQDNLQNVVQDIITENVVVQNMATQDMATQHVEKIEMNDYYWYLSLLVDLHLEIGRWDSPDNPMFFAVGLINELKYYSNMDVIEYLARSFDIQKTLDSLLSDISILLDQSKAVMNYIENNLLLLKTQKTDCDELKDISDKNFSLALKDLDMKNMDINLRKSLDYDKCSSDNRINYNALNKILWELDFYRTILAHKYDYFYRQRSVIVENYQQILYQLRK